MSVNLSMVQGLSVEIFIDAEACAWACVCAWAQFKLEHAPSPGELARRRARAERKSAFCIAQAEHECVHL